MNEVELEQLVVRLLGEGSEYFAMLKQAETQAAASGAKIEGSLNKLQEAGKAALGLLAGMGAKAKLEEWFHKFSEAEKGEMQLKAALKARGEAVESVMADYKEYAAVIQETTTLDDDAALALLKTASMYDLVGDAAKRATKQSIALAAAGEVDPQSAMRLIAAFQKGDMETAKRFARMIGPLRGIKDEAKFAEKFETLLAAGAEMVAAETESAAGRLKQFGNALDNLKENLGSTVAEGVKPAIIALQGLVEWFQRQPEWIQKATVYIFAFAAATVTLATVGPMLLSVAASVKAATIAFVTNPIVLWGVAITAAVATAGYLIAKLSGLSSALSNVNEQLERAKELQAERGKIEDRRTEAVLDQTKNMDRHQKAQFLTDQIKQTSSEVDNYKKALEQARAVREDEWFVSIERFQEAGRQMTFYKEMIDKARERVGKLKEEQEKMGQKTLLDNMKDMQTELEKSIRNLGQNEDEIKRNELATKGLTAAQLANIDALIEQKRVRDEMVKNMKAGEDFTKSMKDDMEAMRMRLKGREAEWFKLFQKGGFSTNMASATAKAMAQQVDLLEKAQQATEQFKDPQEVLAERQDELNKMLDMGAISWDIYTKAMMDAARQAEGTKVTVQAAVQAGSAEAVARVAEFMDVNRFDTSGFRSKPVGAFNASPVNSAEAQSRKEEKVLLDRIARATEALKDRPAQQLEVSNLR